MNADTFAKIEQKCLNRNRLNVEEALWLYEEADLIELGQLANQVNQMKNDDRVYYNLNRHINPTNVCVKSCKFCAFSRKPGDEGAYAYTIEEIVERAKTVEKAGAQEVHMVGGLHPRWNFEHYLNILRSIKSECPSLHIKAFTAVEIDWLAAKARMSIHDTLKSLNEAGLDSMPGGGAEIFHPEIRTQICDTKTDADRWIDIHRTAHAIGIKSNCTMLYGHIENYSHRVDHMNKLRDLQDETNGFNVFIPLSFQPDDNEIGKTRYTRGEDDLRTLAVARLFLDNFSHIKSYWIMLGQDIAQLGTQFGANDLDGTVVEEKISRMAGGKSGMSMDRDGIENLILKAHKTPVERDTLYNTIKERKNPGLDLEKKQNAESILYKIEKGEWVEDLLPLALHADLFALSHASKLNRSLEVLCDKNTLDLVTNSLDDITDQNTVSGIKTLIGKRDPEVLNLLLDEGIQKITSSENESESDLTGLEVETFWKNVAETPMRGVAQIELVSDYLGNPMWEIFCDRLKTLRVIHKEFQCLDGIKVVPGIGSQVSSAEFFRACALVNTILGDLNIIVPYEKIPTLKSRKNVLPHKDPALKVVGLLPYYGVSQISLSDESIIAEINEEMGMAIPYKVHNLEDSFAGFY